METKQRGMEGESRIARKRLKRQLVNWMIRIATAIALLTSLMVLLLAFGRLKYRPHAVMQEQIKVSIHVLPEVRYHYEFESIDIYNGGSLRATRHRRSSDIIPRHPMSVDVNADVTGSWPNGLTTGGIYSIENEIAVSTTVGGDDVMMTLDDAMKHGNGTVFERTKAFCEASISDGNNATHNASEGGHGKHDACKTERDSGLPALWTILYIFVVLFLFIALAIICDDFFVPSLEAISERLNLSDDVAGATFMAAGSSAPELFTSIAGIGAGSDVGVGTIVGSAVFNLLVIIALTSALAGRILQIDWRPLIRDSIFYALSIVTFILFSWDAVFAWWESLTLLLLYVLYIVTMKFNPMLMDYMATWTCCSCFESKVGRISPTVEEGKVDDDKVEDVETTVDTNPPTAKNEVAFASLPEEPEKKTKFRKSQSLDVTRLRRCECRCCCCCCCCRRNDAKLRNTNDGGTNESGEDTMLCEDCSRAEQFETSYKELGDGVTLECGMPGESPRWSASCQSKNESPPPPYTENEGNFEGASIQRIDAKYCMVRNTGQPHRCRFIRHIRSCSCGPLTSGEDFSSIATEVKEVGTFMEHPGEMELMSGRPDTSEESAEATPTPLDASDTPANNNEEEEEETMLVFPCLPPIRHPPPDKPDSSHCVPSAKYLWNLFVYVLSFPWICAYTWTIPDCSKPETRKWYIFSFLMSIAWIAGISYVMVGVVEIVGCLLGVDTYTMGLLVIAVGTSVPDALSSVLVAREGFGDMAVSNAIGSNVFDINLGLGLPFLIASLITSKPVQLLSPIQTCLLENLPLTLHMVPHVKFGFILLLILAICLLLFVAVRFRLNRAIGVIFVIMYFVFMVYAFVQEKACHGFFC